MKVLETRNNKFGEDHPSTLTSMANLAHGAEVHISYSSG